MIPCWTDKCDRRFNEAYRLFWQENIVVDDWLAIAAWFNWIILSAPTVSHAVKVWRAEPRLPNYAKGTVIPIRRFVATSLSLAACITSGFFDEKQRCCAYEIVLPPQFPLLSIFSLGFSHYEDEVEILLPATFDASGLNPTYGLQIIGQKTVTVDLFEYKDGVLFQGYIEDTKERLQHKAIKYEVTVFVCVPVLMSGSSKSFSDVDVWEGSLRQQFSKSKAPNIQTKKKHYEEPFWKQPNSDLKTNLEKLRKMSDTADWPDSEIIRVREEMIKFPESLLKTDKTRIQVEQLNIKLALINQQIESLITKGKGTKEKADEKKQVIAESPETERRNKHYNLRPRKQSIRHL